MTENAHGNDWVSSYQVVLDEARRSLDHQVASIYEARQRAVALIGAAGVVGAALGFTLDGTSSPTTAGVIAIFGFFWAAVAATLTLLPRDLHVDLGPRQMAAWLPDRDSERVFRSVIEAHGANFVENERDVEATQYWIIHAVIGLSAETLALLYSVVF